MRAAIWIMVGWCCVGIALALVLILSACARQDAGAPSPQLPAHVEHLYDTPYIGEIAEIRLDDGTRCVAASRGGIVCEWKR